LSCRRRTHVSLAAVILTYEMCDARGPALCGDTDSTAARFLYRFCTAPAPSRHPRKGTIRTSALDGRRQMTSHEDPLARAYSYAIADLFVRPRLPGERLRSPRRRRRPPRAANWLPLADGDELVMVREYRHDPDAQRTSRLSLERIGSPRARSSRMTSASPAPRNGHSTACSGRWRLRT